MLKLMPEMMKRIKGSEITKMIGELMSGMMFVTHKSRLGFAETVQEIKRRGEEAGWYNPTIHNHLEIERNFGLKDPNKVANVSMCILRSAYEILKVNNKLAVMMPFQISLFEEKGQVRDVDEHQDDRQALRQHGGSCHGRGSTGLDGCA